MKKQIALAMGLAVVSGSAFASKARLEALGEDANGSQFISDNRNIFLNAATVNFHKDMVTFEWGNSDQSEDASATPRAEAGFLKAAGNMVYGLHFGSESDTSNDFRESSGVEVYEDRNIDFFIGGDAGVQWGASLTYSDTNNETLDDVDAPTEMYEDKQSAMRVRLGAVSGNISGFANINLVNTAERTTKNLAGTTTDEAEFEGKSGYDLGATYEMNDTYYMVRHQSLTGEDKKAAAGAEDEISSSSTRVGVAKAYKMNDRSNMWVSAWYRMDNRDEFGTETEANYLPVTMAAEVEVKDWLALRGSVGHVVIGSSEVKVGGQTFENSVARTLVNAGATLSFGDFAVDGLIGNGGTAGTAGGNGTLNTDSLLSRVSMTYRF